MVRRICLYHLSRLSVRLRSSLALCGSTIIGIISNGMGCPASSRGCTPAASCMISGRITRLPVPPTRNKNNLIVRLFGNRGMTTVRAPPAYREAGHNEQHGLKQHIYDTETKKLRREVEPNAVENIIRI